MTDEPNEIHVKINEGNFKYFVIIFEWQTLINQFFLFRSYSSNCQ